MAVNIIEMESLLEPISEQNITGLDLRQDPSPQSLYRQARQARANARTVERQQLQGQNSSTKADWKTVYQLAFKILESHSKDLEVVTWLMEAALRLEGFSGLSASFKLAVGLIEKYWDILYPLPDEEGLITKIAPFTGLNGEEVEGSLITPIALTPIIYLENGAAVTLWHYQQALAQEKLPEKQRQILETISLEQIKAAVQSTTIDIHILDSCIDNFNSLVAILNQKCGKHAPPTTKISDQLNSCLNCLHTILPTPETLTHEESLLPREKLDEPQTNEKQCHKNFQTRDQALESLIVVAQFFRTKEPHSPLPYILERAVRWGKMALPELLKELLQDEQSKKQLSQLTGIEFK